MTNSQTEALALLIDYELRFIVEGVEGTGSEISLPSHDCHNRSYHTNSGSGCGWCREISSHIPIPGIAEACLGRQKLVGPQRTGRRARSCDQERWAIRPTSNGMRLRGKLAAHARGQS